MEELKGLCKISLNLGVKGLYKISLNVGVKGTDDNLKKFFI